MQRAIACFLILLIWVQVGFARVARSGNNSQVAVQNRSHNVNQNANVNRNANLNRNTNVNNNTNINRNVDVNRNVNVNVNTHGGYYGGCCYYHDNDWNWGSFAAGAAVGVATTAAVAAATRPASTTTVVTTAPAVGSIVNVLPGGCGSVAAGGGVIYNCNNIYYRPYYQGTTLVYQIVTYP